MSNTNIGLDIGSQQIKVVEIEKSANNRYHLVNLGLTSGSKGGLKTDSEQELEAIAVSIKKIFTEHKISHNRVRIAVPEAQVFTLVIETPPLSEKEMSMSIKWEAEQYIPLSLSDVILDWRILVQGQKEGEKNLVLLVAVPKRVVQKYQKVLEMAHLVPVSLETELIAASRALSVNVQKISSVMVVNMGRKQLISQLVIKIFYW